MTSTTSVNFCSNSDLTAIKSVEDLAALQEEADR